MSFVGRFSFALVRSGVQCRAVRHLRSSMRAFQESRCLEGACAPDGFSPCCCCGGACWPPLPCNGTSHASRSFGEASPPPSPLPAAAVAPAAQSRSSVPISLVQSCVRLASPSANRKQNAADATPHQACLRAPHRPCPCEEISTSSATSSRTQCQGSCARETIAHSPLAPPPPSQLRRSWGGGHSAPRVPLSRRRCCRRRHHHCRHRHHCRRCRYRHRRTATAGLRARRVAAPRLMCGDGLEG
mmetsp:Transcript_53555/g.138446  ORF Transcript_53555/g.138446 Transcript_53555/m.138446 type:complete len:243 (-) Transcript_53555:2326-3054(-)